ncbi:MAG: FAD:protein FMN transferase [Flavobacteriales bacterium]|nr:FAD:protein FMN transferase [Flavobacteriales bacterium]
MKRVVFIFIAAVGLAACGTSEPPDQETPSSTFLNMVITGEAQGTTYTIRYIEDTVDYKTQVDSILLRIDQDLSTWVPSSLINQINAFDRTDTVFAFYDSTKYFSVMFDVSREIWNKTDGAFDPTVYPLVDLWGFGLSNRGDVNDEAVMEAQSKVGMMEANIDMIELEENYLYQTTWIRKGQEGVRLDFNAIAQGFSVDLIAEFLEEQGVNNYMVELGGEVSCKGVNAEGNAWRIAIDKPKDDGEREFQAIVNVRNKAVATSGNYRKFYEVDGVRYSHTIDPRTGYPVTHSLLSATVIASNCATADAYATSFMVMGKDDAIAFIEDGMVSGLEVYLIYDEGGVYKTWMTAGMSEVIEELNDL